MQYARLLLPASPGEAVTDGVCSCCGQPAGNDSVALKCHPDIVLCSVCVDWLAEKRDRQVAGEGVRVQSVEPMFRVADVKRAVDHYGRLGFATEYHDESYAFALRNDVTIHLAHIDTPEQQTTATIFLHVDDVDRLAVDWRKAGMEVVGPDDQDYGLREASHLDPDGNLIRFGSPRRNRATAE